MVVLPSERRTLKARLFLGVVYSILILGGVTMVLPFMVMVSSSFSGPWDYQRHSPALRALWDRNDRFMRSVASYHPRYVKGLLPGAPETWGSWNQVAKDRETVDKVVGPILDGLSDPARLAEVKSGAESFRDRILAADIGRTTCNYDPRDVPEFVKGKYGTVENLNDEWPVKYRGFFDVSFFAESKAAFWYRGWKEPQDAKWRTWLEFKDSYRLKMAEEGDYLCRTLPYRPDGTADPDEWKALAMQFREHGWRDFFRSAFANYSLVGSYLFVRGRAFFNTIVLVALSILAALTVNPLAAYALSRFKLRHAEGIILFLLATMAFPAAVTAIPGFLLIRDLGLLNTFAALVLPTVASGMSIFVLKGFFDALPRELYEAAAIDGASELLIFRKITLPMTTPILAVNALTAFVTAYNSWAWAFLVCQKESHWTLAVWMYQMSQNFSGQPWCVMAGFVLVSIPTAIVFLLCQKVILRGVVLPSMK